MSEPLGKPDAFERRPVSASGMAYHGHALVGRIDGTEFCIVAPTIFEANKIWNKFMPIKAQADKAQSVMILGSNSEGKEPA